MATFTYEALNAQGKPQKGTVEATSSDEAIQRIKAQGYFPTTVREQKVKKGASGGEKGKKETTKKASGGFTMPFVKVKPKLLTAFTRQLSTLQDAGLPLLRSLQILESQMKPGLLKNTLIEVVEDVEGGSSLSDAFAKQPRAFNTLYVKMVHAGEIGGVLDIILQRLSEFMEKSERLKRRIKGAMIYPIGVVLFWKLIRKAGPGRAATDWMLLKIPVLGTLIKKTVIARFTRTLGTLISAGVPILEAVTITAETSGNAVFHKALMKVHDSIREGETFAVPLRESKTCDAIVVNMIDVGEETGEMDTMLMKIADNYDEEVDVAVSALVSLLEPVMVIVIGVMVGTIVVAMFLPLVAMIESLQGGSV